MQQPPNFNPHQPFYLVTEPPKPPATKRYWGLTVIATIITLLIFMLGFGVVSQQPESGFKSQFNSKLKTQNSEQLKSPTPSALPQTIQIQTKPYQILEVHSLPESNSPIVAILENGNSVQVLSVIQIEESTWTNIRYGNSSGWILAQYLENGQ